MLGTLIAADDLQIYHVRQSNKSRGLDEIEVPRLGIVKLHGFARAAGRIGVLLVRCRMLHQITQVHVKGEQAPWWSEVLWWVLQQGKGCHQFAV